MKAWVVISASILLIGCDRAVNAPETAMPVEIRELSEEEYDGFIATPGKLIAVMFHADWCEPCRQLGPVVEEVIEEFEGKVALGKVDVDELPELAKSLGVDGIPDLRLFRNGVMVDAMKGAIPRELFRNHVAIQVAELGESPANGEEAAATAPVIEPMKKPMRSPGPR